jgi:hypothetical protein
MNRTIKKRIALFLSGIFLYSAMFAVIILTITLSTALGEMNTTLSIIMSLVVVFLGLAAACIMLGWYATIMNKLSGTDSKEARHEMPEMRK